MLFAYIQEGQLECTEYVRACALRAGLLRSQQAQRTRSEDVTF